MSTDLFEAAAERDKAITQVMYNSPVWANVVARLIHNLTNFEGTGEDLRKTLNVAPPHHHNAWGGAIMGAVKRGDLIKTGELRNMKGAKSHARMTPVYRSRLPEIPAEKTPDWYILTPHYEPPFPGPRGRERVLNASVGVCGLCGAVVTGMGGSNDIVCVPCTEIVLSGRARGAIIRGDNDDGN